MGNKEKSNRLYADVSEFNEYFDDIKSHFAPIDISFLEDKIREIYEMNIGNTDCAILVLNHHGEEIEENHLENDF